MTVLRYHDELAQTVTELDTDAPAFADALNARLDALYVTNPYAYSHTQWVKDVALALPAERTFELLSPYVIRYRHVKSPNPNAAPSREANVATAILSALVDLSLAAKTIDLRWFKIALAQLEGLAGADHLVCALKPENRRELLIENWQVNHTFPSGLLAAAAKTDDPRFLPVLAAHLRAPWNQKQIVPAALGLFRNAKDEYATLLRAAVAGCLETQAGETSITALTPILFAVCTPSESDAVLKQAIAFRKAQSKLRTSRDKADVLEKAAMKRELVALQALLARSL